MPSFPDRNVVHVGSVRGVNAFSEMNDDDGVLRFRDTLWFDCSTDAKAYALFEMLRSLSSAGLLPNVRFSYQASMGKRVVFEVESGAVVKARKLATRRRARASR